jgi:hypothetical protein
MTTRTVERVDDWNTRPFDGGYRGLHDLADEEFSGVVQSDTAKLCMLNGSVIGVLGGTIADFEDASGTAYEAPSAALPLLLLMQERSDEVRAKYYTEDTPLSQVDRKLSEGGFTGYVELSENVLSGDYFTVYHGGRSMSVAFLGESARLETDEEAFRLADDEVGIYEVRPVAIDVVEIPDPEPEPDPDPAAGVSGTTETTEPDDRTADADDPVTDSTGETGPADGPVDSNDPDASESSTVERTSDAGSTDTATETPTAADEPGTPSSAGTADRTTEGDEDATGAQTDTDTATSSSDAANGRTDGRDDSDSLADTAATSAGDAAERDTESGRQSRAGPMPSDDATTGAPEPASPSQSPPEPDGRDAAETDDDSTTIDETSPDDGPGRESGSDESSSTHESADPDAVGGESVATGASRSRRVESGVDEPEPRDTGSEEPLATDQSGMTDAAPEPPTDTDDARPEGPEALEIHAVPSLDPTRTENGAEDDPDIGGSSSLGSDTQSQDRSTTRTRAKDRRSGSTERQADRPESRDDRSSGQATAASATADSELVAELRTELDERAKAVSNLESELSSVREERDRLADERDDLAGRVQELERERDELNDRVQQLESERDDLRSEIDQLEATLEQHEAGETATDVGSSSGTELSRQQALEGTNLFVRYESKGKPTLEAAHDGNADREEVNRNLKLEYHTQFDAAETTVDGQPFDDFLTGTMEYQFVDWLVHDLLYEIRDTGKTDALEELYDALPLTDRAQLDGEVAVTYEEDGEQRHGEETFDVVIRDRMGDPIVVANLNDSRLEASESMMTSLIQATSRVCDSKETLSTAFLVTRSFFEPEALETATEATGGGLLSRDKRQSFVKISRKRGYHLCLAEGRNDEFHMTVPEL